MKAVRITLASISALFALLCIPAKAHAVLFQALGFLTGDDQSVPYGISANGKVAVGYSAVNGGFDREAFRWTSNTGIVGLGQLPGASTGSWALVVALAKIGSPRALAELRRAFSDHESIVRTHAVEALANLAGRPRSRLLREAGKREEAKVSGHGEAEESPGDFLVVSL